MKLSKRFPEALSYSFLLHRNQERKGSGVPYVAHILAVASLVLDHRGDEDEAIAALLHDAVEDQGGEQTAADIRRVFGDRVADIVIGCSDSLSTTKPPWRERKQQYLAHLETASPSVQLVSSCDKLHNARCILEDYLCEKEALWERFTGGREGVLWYYRALANMFERANVSCARELVRTVNELETAVGVMWQVRTDAAT